MFILSPQKLLQVLLDTHNHRSIYQAGVTTNNTYKITFVYYIITGTQCDNNDLSQDNQENHCTTSM